MSRHSCSTPASQPAGRSEVYRLVLEPGAEHRSVPHGAGVVEHLLLTRGRARVGRVGDEVEIAAGEAAEWVSDIAHGYAVLGEEPVESVLVIRTPGSSSPECQRGGGQGNHGI